jgi:hypothetical protein
VIGREERGDAGNLPVVKVAIKYRGDEIFSALLLETRVAAVPITVLIVEPLVT